MIALAAGEEGRGRLLVRLMVPFLDMNQVLAISDATYQWDAWTPEEILSVLTLRHCFGVVAESGDTVVGYMILEKDRHSLVIQSMAVSKTSQRQGVGRAMLRTLRDQMLISPWMRNIELIVEDTNLVAQLFLKSQGFQATLVLPDYFPVTDGYLFNLDLPGAARGQIEDRIQQLK